MHILEGPNGEGSSEVGVHCAGVGVNEGSKAKHFLHRADLLDQGHVVNFGMGGHDVGLCIACRGCVGAMTSHVAFISRSGLQEMGVD